MRDCNNYGIISTDRFTLGNNTKSIVVFANPHDSETTMELVQINHANLSCTPVVIDSFNCAKVIGDLTFTSLPVIENMSCSACGGFKAKVAYGTGDVMDMSRHLLVHTIRAYETYYEPFPCSLILPPGTNRVYLFDAIEPRAIATICSGFVWTEKRLSN